MPNNSLNRLYGHKIKTPEELRAILGPVPREKRAIMCHGVFDVVHPGHIRHLAYAKGKADILITSVTADAHITKGLHRPHVPQDLRALNLAALEMVDYVVVDVNATPLDNLKLIQPDLFAKGYEYTTTGMRPKTAEEAEAVRAYGGEIVFTPGDIVYSSSKLIELEAPKLRFEKLQIIMERKGISFEDLRRAINALSAYRVHVVGDTIVDSYTNCVMIGGQTKTPTLSVLFESKTDYAGGAAIVAKHCRAAGADVSFCTVLGDDAYAEFVVNDLQRAGVSVSVVTERGRPTVNKNAIVVGGYRLLKVDTLDNNSITDAICNKMTDTVRNSGADAVIYADFRHGIFNRRTIPDFIEAIPANAYRVADSQVASRWGNITEFRGFDLITPNEREARFALADQDSGIRPLASAIFDEAQCKLLILKLGQRGVLVCQSTDHESLDSFFVLDSFVENLVDPVGAGDALLAYSTLAMLATKDPTQATIIGLLAAACECECDGNAPIAPKQILKKLDAVEKQTNYV